MIVDRIEVVCDDPRHNGHLGEVDTFVRLTPWGMWIAQHHHFLDAPTASRRDHFRSGGELIRSFRCERCPRRKPQQLECSDDMLQWLLNCVADHGISQPTVRMLNVVLSNRS